MSTFRMISIIAKQPFRRKQYHRSRPSSDTKIPKKYGATSLLFGGMSGMEHAWPTALSYSQRLDIAPCEIVGSQWLITATLQVGKRGRPRIWPPEFQMHTRSTCCSRCRWTRLRRCNDALTEPPLAEPFRDESACRRQNDRSCEAIGMAVGSGSVLNYVWAGLFHPARKSMSLSGA